MKRKNLLIGFYAIGKSYMQKETNDQVQEIDVIKTNTLISSPETIESYHKQLVSSNKIGYMANLCLLNPYGYYESIEEIPKFIVYPSLDQKEEYLERMNGRDVIDGKVTNLFYHFMKEGNIFETVLKAYEDIEEDENTVKVVLKPGQYLSDVIGFSEGKGFYLKENVSEK